MKIIGWVVLALILLVALWGLNEDALERQQHQISGPQSSGISPDNVDAARYLGTTGAPGYGGYGITGK